MIGYFLHIQSLSTSYASSIAGDEYNASDRRSLISNNYNHGTEEQHNGTHNFNIIPSNSKNPCGLNQAEIICAVALEMLTAARSVINPLTNEPFRIKFGESFLSCNKNRNRSSYSYEQVFTQVQLLVESLAVPTTSIVSLATRSSP